MRTDAPSLLPIFRSEMQMRLLVGDADLASLRKLVRPIGKSAGRNVDLTALGEGEFRRLRAERSSFTRRVMEAPMTLLVGDLASVASQ